MDAYDAQRRFMESQVPMVLYRCGQPRPRTVDNYWLYKQVAKMFRGHSLSPFIIDEFKGVE